MESLCKKICKDYSTRGYTLITGNADGIDGIARDAWIDPTKVILVLPWDTYNKNKINQGNRVIVYNGQPDWAQSVYKLHPSPNRLSQGAFKLHARNYGIIVDAAAVVAFPSYVNGNPSGGTMQGIRIARKLGKICYICPQHLI